jgi:hypothetical protein
LGRVRAIAGRGRNPFFESIIHRLQAKNPKERGKEEEKMSQGEYLLS